MDCSELKIFSSLEGKEYVCGERNSFVLKVYTTYVLIVH